MPRRDIGRMHHDGDDLRPSLRGSKLVDADLGPEAEDAARTVELGFIRPAGRRAEAIFLRRDDTDRVEHDLNPLIADLLLECLGRFVRQGGGKIVMVFDPDHGLASSTLRSVTVDGEDRFFLNSAHVFLHFPDKRVVVSARQDSPWRTLITVRSDGPPDTFFHEWEAHAKRDNYLRGRAFFADGEIIERTRHYSWESIVMPAHVKETIRTHVEGFFRHLKAIKAYGVKPRRGLILAGPAGTGKTLLGKVLADTLDASFTWVLPRHIEDASSFKHILALARFVAPTVLFIEDLDLFAQDREARSWVGLGELMNQLDGALENEDIVTIATTNRLEVIEKALRNRPGRFERAVIFEAMDEMGRHSMLRRLLAKAEVSAADLNYLVSATEGCTGAEIEEVTNTLFIRAIDATAQDDDDAPCGQPLPMDRAIMEAAVGEVLTKKRTRIGFNAA